MSVIGIRQGEQEKVDENNYNIFLETPLGIRKGMLHISVDNAEVNGYLELLGRHQPLSGKIGSDGQCCLNGKLKTLMSEFSYKATGNISGGRVDLTISRGQHALIKKERCLLKITGYACSNTEKEG